MKLYLGHRSPSLKEGLLVLLQMKRMKQLHMRYSRIKRMVIKTGVVMLALGVLSVVGTPISVFADCSKEISLELK